jgi:hypothetical protein
MSLLAEVVSVVTGVLILWFIVKSIIFLLIAGTFAIVVFLLIKAAI